MTLIEVDPESKIIDMKTEPEDILDEEEMDDDLDEEDELMNLEGAGLAHSLSCSNNPLLIDYPNKFQKITFYFYLFLEFLKTFCPITKFISNNNWSITRF